MMISIAVAVLGLGLVGGALAAKPVLDKQDFPASFVLTSATCPNLPPDTTITGTGTGKSITLTRENRGVTTISNVTHIKGTATDQAGNRYVFNYLNTFNISNTISNTDVFSGTMVDSFVLAGRGPARLSNGFRAVFTTDFSTFATLEELSSRGDPIDFATGAARCDPL